MNYPKTIRIGSQDYELLMSHVFEERDDLAGQIHGDISKIRIKSTTPGGVSMTDERIMATVLHEIMHGINHHAGYNPSAKIFDMEDCINIFSNGLLQVFRDNRKLGKILTEELWKR